MATLDKNGLGGDSCAALADTKGCAIDCAIVGTRWTPVDESVSPEMALVVFYAE